MLIRLSSQLVPPTHIGSTAALGENNDQKRLFGPIQCGDEGQTLTSLDDSEWFQFHADSADAVRQAFHEEDLDTACHQHNAPAVIHHPHDHLHTFTYHATLENPL